MNEMEPGPLKDEVLSSLLTGLKNSGEGYADIVADTSLLGDKRKFRNMPLTKAVVDDCREMVRKLYSFCSAYSWPLTRLRPRTSFVTQATASSPA